MHLQTSHLQTQVFAAERLQPPNQLDDCLDVLVPLLGQADHEVKLDGGVAQRESLPSRVDDIRLGDVLVDDVAQALAARLWGQGDRGASPRGDAVSYTH